METWKTILQILSVVLLIVAIIFRKQPWGKKLLYFALGMIVAFALTDGFDGIKGFEAQRKITQLMTT